MSGFDGFIGSERLIGRLRRDIAQGTISHAYLIEGGEGFGKKTLAKLICLALSCHENDAPCMSCPRCRKILTDQTPDVITVLPEKGKVQLGVEIIRNMRDSVVFAPNDLERKFYIIPDASAMTVESQNALLKTLEEPPPCVMFLLLTENAENLLPTIRSRAPALRLEPLSNEQIAAWLTENSDEARALREREPKAFGVAVRRSGGSLGRAIKLCTPESAEKNYAMYEKAERYLTLLADSRSAAGEFAFFEYASKLQNTKQREELDLIYEMLTEAVRDLAAAKLLKNAFPPLFYTDEAAARETAARFSASGLMKLSDAFAGARSALPRSAPLPLVQMKNAVEALNSFRS